MSHSGKAGLPQDTPPLAGLLVVDKPLGMSSMGVVSRVRRAAMGARTGHAGTLDPLATGVLVCALGKATRSIELLMGLTKVYETVVDLSAFTTTDDREGERTEVTPALQPDEATVRCVLEQFTGVIQQKPPAFSAVHVQGKRAYKLARKGQEVDLPARPVRIDALELLSLAYPLLSVRVTCGKGTYIRSLARDMGKALGTGGHLASLRRTAIGPYTLAQAVRLEDLPRPLPQDWLLPVPAAPQPPATDSAS